ncbi:MAG: class I SAM-dependent methyltransferase [Solirubrobacteraceae bacterium]
MAVLNSDMERRAVDRLTLASGARLLAVGFGPGIGVIHATNQISDGIIAGVDPSPVMLAQAQRRVRRAGRTADLRLGAVSQLPWPDRSFDAVVSVNNVQLWHLPEDLHEVHRVLTGEGRLAVAVHASMLARHLGASSPQDASERLATIISDASFVVAGSEVKQARTGPAIYVLAAVR